MPVVHVPRSESPRVSLVIPSAADPDILFACLRSLSRHLPASIPTETIVVLDGAPEGSAARVEKAAPGVLVVASAVRLGLARAANRGRRRARGEFVALLHDDSEIDAGWLEALVAAADAHPEAGAFGGVVSFPDGAPQTAGVVLFRNGAALPPWPAFPPAAGPGPSRAADFCASNALLVRAAAWDAAGGLDPRFFPAYFVDADLAMALRAAGWTVRFVPSATSRHRRGASSRRQFREWVSGRNRRAFVEKWKEALADYEPWDGGSPKSFARAVEGAGARAARLENGPRLGGAPPAAGDLDPADEMRALRQEADVQAAWAAHLEAALGFAPEGSERRTVAIEELLWWRIYVRLLPILRPLRAMLRPFSRR